MEQTKNVKTYGNVTFVFNQDIEDALSYVETVKDEECYIHELYDTEKESTIEEKNKELSDIKEYVETLFKDCAAIATDEIISSFGKKKNGKFRKGAIAHFKIAETCTNFATDFTNSWEALVVTGKTLSENEIEVKVGFKWFTY